MVGPSCLSMGHVNKGVMIGDVVSELTWKQAENQLEVY